MDPLERNDSPSLSYRPRARHRWIPALLLGAATGWWLWQAVISRYQTLNHVLVVLGTIFGVALWHLTCGAASAKTRRRVFVLVGLTLFAGYWVFQPVYNGAMGIATWKLRFAGDADEQLEAINSSRVADDWRTSPKDYPRFLGSGPWAEVPDVKLETDWQSHPPRELWRRPIGGGWSSFAIVGQYAITQEQRGDKELVACYRVATGEPVWTHADVARFDPADFQGSLGDIGPRATPTVAGDRVFTQGGTGLVNCLDARTGNVIWSHDTAKEFDVPVTTWGKSGSPLVINDVVIVSVGAPPEVKTGAKENESPRNCSLVAFDRDDGTVRWQGGTRLAAYASPTVMQLAGEQQVLIVNQSWLTAHRLDNGEVLWEVPWEHEEDSNASVSQPVAVGEDRVFLSKGYGTGSTLLRVTRDLRGQFSATPVWEPPVRRVMKTKFSNVVIRNGYVYGLDDVLLSCIELNTGKLQWKKRRSPEFGYGQIMLIGDVLLVLSESGEVILVAASPDNYRELASLQALDDANITWNNPAFSSPYLLVRNAREAACYELPLKH